jgi:hypothetical protein
MNMARNVVMPCQGIIESVLGRVYPSGAIFRSDEVSLASGKRDSPSCELVSVFDELVFAFPFAVLDSPFRNTDLDLNELACSTDNVDSSLNALDDSSSGMAVELRLSEDDVRQDAEAELKDSLERRRWSALLSASPGDRWL